MLKTRVLQIFCESVLHRWLPLVRRSRYFSGFGHYIYNGLCLDWPGRSCPCPKHVKFRVLQVFHTGWFPKTLPVVQFGLATPDTCPCECGLWLCVLQWPLAGGLPALLCKSELRPSFGGFPSPFLSFSLAHSFLRPCLCECGPWFA